MSHSARSVPVVIYRPVRCPRCGSTNQRKTRTVPNERAAYHICRNCKRTFKTVTEPRQLTPRVAGENGRPEWEEIK